MVVGFVGLSIGGWAATKVQGQLASTGISVPSGQPVTFLQFISEGEGSTLRCLLYTSPSPRDKRQSRMPSSA